LRRVATRIEELEFTLTAERNAVASRIRELETDLESHRKAAAAQRATFWFRVKQLLKVTR
jgi:hypothetical protein